MARLENNFAWSATRGATLERCPREYYWTYYGSWGGWERWATDTQRLAHRLKKLCARHTWAGRVVHDVIRRVLGDVRDGRAVDSKQLILGAHETMQSEWRRSRSGTRSKNQRGFRGLLEHEYGEKVSRTEWKDLWRRTEACLGAFFGCGLLSRFAALSPDGWLEVDRDVDGGPPSWEMDGVRIFAVPDLVTIETGAPVVYEWKTGSPKPSDETQVLGYALYLEYRYSMQPTSVEAQLIYLADSARQVTCSTTAERLEQFKAKLRADIERARQFLSDVKRNVPLPIGAFAQTSSLDTCRRCAFRRLCGR